MSDTLQKAIATIKAGNKIAGKQLLTDILETDPDNEQAWLWMSGVVDDDSERLFCLDSVLKINPANTAAQRGASLLRQKGVFPAIPVFPAPNRTSPWQESPHKPISTSNSSRTGFVDPLQPSKVTTAAKPSNLQMNDLFNQDLKKKQLTDYFQYAAMELSNERSPREVEKILVGKGVAPDDAKMVVADARYAIRKGRREKYKKRLTRGLIWTVLGVVITCGTYIFASELGGKFFLFYGAIIFGFIDFMIGLIGWLSNS